MDNCPKPKHNNIFGLEKHLREQHKTNLCKVRRGILSCLVEF